MTRFTQHDRHLWGVLIAVVNSERITNVSRIHKAAKRVSRAAIPEGWCFMGSCFHQLAKCGAVLKGGDPQARADLRVHAEACRAVLEALDAGRAVDPLTVIGHPASKSPPSGCAGVPPARQGDMTFTEPQGRRFRRDIDG